MYARSIPPTSDSIHFGLQLNNIAPAIAIIETVAKKAGIFRANSRSAGKRNQTITLLKVIDIRVFNRGESFILFVAYQWIV